MKRTLPTLLALVALLLPLAIWADDAPPPGAARPAAPKTLAQALTEAETPNIDVYLTVGADTMRPPKGAELPPPGYPIFQVAQAYGLMTHGFETVTAIAPPSMTLLNTDPGTPNPYDGIPHGDALRLLLGSLSDTQWAALTGKTGLGPSDMTDARQRGLFAALFPPGGLTLHPDHQWDGGGQAEDQPLKLAPQDMALVRLHLGQRIMIGIPIIGQKGWMDSPAQAPDGKLQFQMYGGEGERDKDTLYGVPIRETVPNAPKASDLDLDTSPMKRTVSLNGLKTVGDVIARVGKTVGVEMYADRRFEGQAVTVLGPTPLPPVRARDVLQALALCVVGTYRAVGPAYMLTNDRVGAGAQRLILSRFSQEADLARSAAVTDAGDALITTRGGVNGLPMMADDLGFSDAQKAMVAKGDTLDMSGQGMQLQIPMGQLTPSQRDTARHFADQWNARVQNNPAPAGNSFDSERVTMEGDMLLMAQPSLTLESPAIPGVCNLEGYFNASDLFQPSSKLQQEMWRKQDKQRQANAAHAEKPAEKPHPAPPALATVMAPFPQRAVIVQSRTAKDVDALVASLKAVGLNQLWLDVFSGGESHLNVKAGEAGPDILTEALAQTKDTGITVIPILDLLDWGAKAPAAAQDLTMLGETSAEAKAHRQRYELVKYSGMTEEEAAKQPIPNLSVSPAADAVHQTLLALVRRLAATPGVHALALRDTVTPGYDRKADSRFGTSGDPLGYTLPLRLAFLRRDHVDPIDMSPESYDGEINANLELPEFPMWETGTAAKDWDAFRSGADVDLLQQLLAAARSSAGRPVPFWIKQRRTAYRRDWYGLWDNPRAPLPELSEELDFGGSGSDTNYAAFAHTQSRANVYQMDGWQAQSKEGLTEGLQALKPGWSGFVLDLSDRPGNALSELAKSLAPPAPTAKTTP